MQQRVATFWHHLATSKYVKSFDHSPRGIAIHHSLTLMPGVLAALNQWSGGWPDPVQGCQLLTLLLHAPAADNAQCICSPGCCRASRGIFRQQHYQHCPSPPEAVPPLPCIEITTHCFPSQLKNFRAFSEGTGSEFTDCFPFSFHALTLENGKSWILSWMRNFNELFCIKLKSPILNQES